MKINKLHIIITSIFLFLLTIACGFSVSTANIKDAFMAKYTGDSYEKVDFYSQDENFLCIVDLANAPDDTVVSAQWYAVDAEGIEPEFFITESSLTEGTSDMYFDLINEDYWPTGTYRVDISLNGEFSQSIEFEVQ